jgi:DNA repair protein SbcC/Rad50
MIERVEIRGFQKWKRLDVDFENMTTFMCPSDGGKSSVLRAIRWVLFNRPEGTSFINWDSDQAKVTLTIDGHRVTRKRSKKVNCYVLDKQKTFKALKGAVPEEVAKILNVGPVNYSSQFVQPFWFSDTPGQVAKSLNEIVNLDVIDSSLANAAAVLRKARAVEEFSRQRLAEARERKEALKWVEGLDADLRKAEAVAARLRAAEAKAEAVQELIGRMEQAEKGRKAVPDLTRLDGLVEAWKAASARETALNAMMKAWMQHEERSTSARRSLMAAEAELAKANEGKCPVCLKDFKG